MIWNDWDLITFRGERKKKRVGEGKNIFDATLKQRIELEHSKSFLFISKA